MYLQKYKHLFYKSLIRIHYLKLNNNIGSQSALKLHTEAQQIDEKLSAKTVQNVEKSVKNIAR